MTRSRLAWGIAGLDLIAMLVVSVVSPAFDLVGASLNLVGIASFAGVGALLCARIPANPIGILLLAAGTILAVAPMVGTYGDLGALQTPPWPGIGLARIFGNVSFIYIVAIALIVIPLIFPDGRLPSARFRWVLWLVVADMAAWTVSGFVDPMVADGTDEAFAALGAIAPLLNAIQGFILLSTIVSFGAAILAVSFRFRRGDPVQRQQIKWPSAVVVVGAVVLPVSLVGSNSSRQLADVLNAITLIVLFSLPIAIGIAVLRYRLFEIDRIISRTLSWALVTGLLLAMFAAVVVALQGILAAITQGQTIAVAASTLAAFALFQPLRRRVQSAVDRRFDRARYDAQRMVDSFAEQLRNEVDLARLRAALVAAADGAVRPVGTAVWLRSNGDAAR